MNTRKTILSRTELDLKVGDLGDELTKICHEYGGGIVFVCVMKGGFMFFSDLIKHIGYPIEVDFIKCSSYEGQEQLGLSLHYDIESDLKDKTVFIVDDILDSGETMKMLKSHFLAHGAKQIKTVSAVYKENVDFPNHFYIYKQPEGVDPWYIGYGMDGPKGYSRNLDTIHTL